MKNGQMDTRLYGAAISTRDALRGVFIPELERVAASIPESPELRQSLARLQEIAGIQAQAINTAMKNRSYARRGSCDNQPAFSVNGCGAER